MPRYEAGAREVNQLKHFTRCGMGPCQGRMCGDVAAELLAATVGGASGRVLDRTAAAAASRCRRADRRIRLRRHPDSGAGAAVTLLTTSGSSVGAMHGATVALFAARGGMDVALLDLGSLCREASGVNAGTLTLQMTRVALIPMRSGPRHVGFARAGSDMMSASSSATACRSPLPTRGRDPHLSLRKRREAGRRSRSSPRARRNNRAGP